MVFLDNEVDPSEPQSVLRAKLDNHDAPSPPVVPRTTPCDKRYDALLINDSAIRTDQTVKYVL